MESAARTKLGQSLYALAMEYLHHELQQRGFSPDVLEYYHCDPAPPKTLNDVYKQLLISAQNAHMRETVVGDSLVGGINRLGEILFDFDGSKVTNHFETSEHVFNVIKAKLNPTIFTSSNSVHAIWPQYCRTILSAAAFMAQFKSLEDFTEWAAPFFSRPQTYMAAPLIVAQEIHGLGFALACDFFKEIGYSKLGKPDVHIKGILSAFDLCQPNDSDYQVLKALSQLAEDVGVTAYNADKLFWLIGSGKFYLHPRIGSIGNQKRQFIKFANSRLA
jgi:hypothetical protein